MKNKKNFEKEIITINMKRQDAKVHEEYNSKKR